MNNATPGGKANAVIQNIGAAAEATALFYNTLAKLVPASVALELTKQYMTVVFQPNRPTQIRIPSTLIQAAVERAAEEARKKQAQPKPEPPKSQSPEPEADAENKEEKDNRGEQG